jgi:hypothetical protein
MLLVKMKGVRRKQACVRRAFLMQGINFEMLVLRNGTLPTL